MYYFNILLFKRLPSLLGMTQAELSDLCLGAKHKFARRIINQDSFPFQELIDTCNRLRISLANFITLNPNEPFLENKYNYIIPEGKFIPIEFKPKNIRFVYGPNGLGGNITRDDFANAIFEGITGFSLTNQIKELTDIHDIVWEYAHRGIVLDSDGMENEMKENPNGRLYWLARKTLQYMRERDI